MAQRLRLIGARSKTTNNPVERESSASRIAVPDVFTDLVGLILPIPLVSRMLTRSFMRRSYTYEGLDTANANSTEGRGLLVLLLGSLQDLSRFS